METNPDQWHRPMGIVGMDSVYRDVWADEQMTMDAVPGFHNYPDPSATFSTSHADNPR